MGLRGKKKEREFCAEGAVYPSEEIRPPGLGKSQRFDVAESQHGCDREEVGDRVKEAGKALL